MTLEHAAIWTSELETLKSFYVKYFNAAATAKYRNETTGFESYFLSFSGGARLELMSKPGIPKNENDTVTDQHEGIIHLAFGVDTMQEVDDLSAVMKGDGYPILKGPRKTGDGYYEFETLDPDKNRLEVTANYTGE